MAVRDKISKEDLARMAEELLRNELFLEVIEELTEGYITIVFNPKTTQEERLNLVNQRAGMDMVINRLSAVVNEYKLVQVNNSLQQN